MDKFIQAPPKTVLYLLAAVTFGLLGTQLLFSSHAATPTAAVESEDGTLGSCVQGVTDTSASSTRAIKFGNGGTCSIDPMNLDATGSTIPDTNYAIPAGAIFMDDSGSDSNSGAQASPVKTLNRAISLVPTDGFIVARAGVYRDWYTGGTANYKINTKGFTLQNYPHEQVWFDGADIKPASSWTSDGSGHWYMDWSTPTFCDGGYYSYPYNAQPTSNTGPCSHYDQYGDPAYPAAGDPQMVFIDGANAQEVASLSGATGGNFYYDWSAKRMYISTDPTTHTVEVAARPVALVAAGTGMNYTFRGIGFRHYATNEYDNLTNPALYIGGSGTSLVENVVFTRNAGSAYRARATGSIVRSSIFAYNGFNGMGANGHSSTGATDNLIVENSIFNNTNAEHFGLNCTASCAAAGIKMAHMVGYTLRNNIFQNGQSKAAGAWCDTDCSGGVFINNLVKDNGGAGYDYEMDNTGIIASNVFLNNNYAINVGASDVKIYNNTLMNSRTIAMRIYDDNRSNVTSNIQIGNNIVYGTAVNANWFANNGGTVGPNSFITALDYNSYWRPTSYTLYRWIDGTDTSFSSLASFQAAHVAWEAHAQDYVGGNDPFFTNFAGGNYTVRNSSSAYNTGGGIPNDVAAATGMTSAAGQTRGAFHWPGNE